MAIMQHVLYVKKAKATANTDMLNRASGC